MHQAILHKIGHHIYISRAPHSKVAMQVLYLHKSSQVHLHVALLESRGPSLRVFSQFQFVREIDHLFARQTELKDF